MNKHTAHLHEACEWFKRHHDHVWYPTGENGKHFILRAFNVLSFFKHMDAAGWRGVAAPAFFVDSPELHAGEAAHCTLEDDCILMAGTALLALAEGDAPDWHNEMLNILHRYALEQDVKKNFYAPST